MLQCNVRIRSTESDKQKSQLTATTYILTLNFAHEPVDFLQDKKVSINFPKDSPLKVDTMLQLHTKLMMHSISTSHSSSFSEDIIF